MYAMTAANKVVPIPCYARVTNLQNGKSVTVTALLGDVGWWVHTSSRVQVLQELDRFLGEHLRN